MRLLRLAAAGSIVLAVVFIASPASAAPISVCAVGCDFTTIKAAVGAANAGDTIDVAGETFNETGPIQITKPVTINGAGAASTTVDGGNQNKTIFDIRPGAATGNGPIAITGMKLTNAGNNAFNIYVGIKQVTTGVTAIDFNQLDINAGTTYGIYAEGGAKIGGVDRTAPPLTLSNSKIHDQANNGIGVDSYRGKVEISTNRFSEGTTGRSGIIVMNEYTTSRMPDPVIIEDNTGTGRLAYIKNYVGSTFGGYDDILVTGNTVTGLEGGASSGCPNSGTDTDCGVFFSSNTADGASSATMGKIEVANNSFQGDLSPTSSGVTIAGAVAEADIHDNNMTRLGYGVRVQADQGLSPTAVSIQHNRLFNDGSGVLNDSALAVDATENWWGCQTDPTIFGNPFCSDAPNLGSGSIDADPWVVTTAALGSTSVEVGDSTPITTDLAHLSNGSSVALPTAYFIGLPTVYAASAGTVDPSAGTLNGGSLADSSTYTAPFVAGPQTITVTVDQDGAVTGEPVELPITVTALPIDNGDGDGDGDGGDGGGGDDDNGALPDTGASTSWWQPWLASLMMVLGAAIVWTSRTRRSEGRRKLA